jgi:glycosyltransferase involved in cell wall biosynthesis
VRLTIVGEAPPAFARRAARRRPARLEVAGRVPDVRPYLARAAVAVCPMPYAAGIQNKVLEAMATETAVVADPPACAALAVDSGREVLIARAPEEFADAILRLLADGALRRRIARAGRAYVERHHRWDESVSRLEAVYAEQLGSPRLDERRRA